MNRRSRLGELETKLGYKFHDISLLERALNHSSLLSEGDVRSLERLEFLGDRVLGLLTAEELWRRYPNFDEGDMAPRLNALVRKETCAEAAVFFGLPEYIRFSKAEEGAGGREKVSVLGDVCEAMLGALYIDGGLEAARKTYNAFWQKNFESLFRRYRDAKTELQEWAQKQGRGVPAYRELNRSGPAHAPLFTVEVQVEDLKPETATGKSKRQAQMDAAEKLLVREGLWEPEND